MVIGGVAIFGGSGTVWGAALGAFLLVTINRALPILGISDFWQGAVVGALIIGSIVLDRVLTLRRTHQLIEARDETDDDRATPETPTQRATTRRTRADSPSACSLNREAAVIAAAGRRLRLLAGQRRVLRQPADDLQPVQGVRADPADGAADDADHHHRRDRPLGGEHPGCLRGCLRRAGQGARRLHARPPSSSRCSSAWSSARSTASSSRTSGCPRWRSPSARSRSTAGSRRA